jgi:hypothetical protein
MSVEKQDELELCQELLAKVIVQPDTATGEDFNMLLRCFNHGFPTEAIRQLLQQGNRRTVLGALFIIEELGKRAAAVLNDAVPFTRNADTDVRYAAYNAVARTAAELEDAAFANVVMGLNDLNPRCRKIAALWLMRVRQAVLIAAIRGFDATFDDDDMRKGLQWLASDPASPVIQTWINGDTRIMRRFGVIAAGRIASSDLTLLRLAAQSEDHDIRVVADAQLQFIAIKARRLHQRGN